MGKSLVAQYFNISLYLNLRDRKFKTQAAFAKAMDVGCDTVCNWDSGKHSPSLANIEKMGAVLDIAPRALITKPGHYIFDKIQNMLYDFFTDTDKNLSEEPFDAKRAKIALEIAERLGYLDREGDEKSKDTSGFTEDELEIYERVKAQKAADVMLP